MIVNIPRERFRPKAHRMHALTTFESFVINAVDIPHKTVDSLLIKGKINDRISRTIVSRGIAQATFKSLRSEPYTLQCTFERDLQVKAFCISSLRFISDGSEEHKLYTNNTFPVCSRVLYCSVDLFDMRKKTNMHLEWSPCSLGVALMQT